MEPLRSWKADTRTALLTAVTEHRARANLRVWRGATGLIRRRLYVAFVLARLLLFCLKRTYRIKEAQTTFASLVREAKTGVWVQAWQRSPDARGLLPGSRWSLRTDRDDGTASKPGSDEGDRRCGGKPWLRLHARHLRGVKHKVQIRERVNLFLEQLPPESRRRLRLALRRMESENADRLALRERLTGYSRLRDGNFRSLSRYVPGRVIESVFAHERSLVYALFEREFLEHLRHEAQGQVPSRRRPH